MNKNIDKIINNMIVRAVISILYCIVIIAINIPAIPYAIVRGACNLDYYEDWFDFIIKYSPFIRYK